MPTLSRKPPPHFIVIVPGFMGSKLRDRTTGKIVWVDFGSIPKNPLQLDDWLADLLRTLAYPNENLEPAGIMDQVIFVPPWAKQEHYSRLVEALGKMGYRADATRYAESELDVYAFAYDWRQDNRISARQLGAAIERWRAYHPGAQAYLIAHSNGGIVARWYIEKEGGKERVGRLFLMGSPWDGTPKAMHMLFSGLDVLFRCSFNLFNIPQRTRDLLRTFPCIYQLVPYCDPFLHDVYNQSIDPFADTSWLASAQQRQLLLDGRRFNQELGKDLSVETLCFFGRKKPTHTHGLVRFAAGGQWSRIEWLATEAGDATVPERSAVHPKANAKLPFVVGHGDIYVNPAVLEFLEWELIGQYQLPKRAIVTMPRWLVQFEPDRDSYAPGEVITLSAQVLTAENKAGQRQPIQEAAIQAQLTWHAPLPGDEAPRVRPRSVRTWLSPTAEPGRYSGQLRAPKREGYYQLSAVVEVAGEKPVRVSELIIVEAGPAGG